jgi:hypothetical protein
MRFRKISLDDNDVLRKYRVKSNNYYASSDVEEFTCGSHVAVQSKGHKRATNFGISKYEYKVSRRTKISGYDYGIKGT